MNILIWKIKPDIASLNCTGIYIDSNYFQKNYGCPNALGNVIIDCEPNNILDMASGNPATPGDIFGGYYTTYAAAVDNNWETSDYANRYLTRYLTLLSINKGKKQVLYY